VCDPPERDTLPGWPAKFPCGDGDLRLVRLVDGHKHVTVARTGYYSPLPRKRCTFRVECWNRQGVNVGLGHFYEHVKVHAVRVTALSEKTKIVRPAVLARF